VYSKVIFFAHLLTQDIFIILCEMAYQFITPIFEGEGSKKGEISQDLSL
jgi:hypothetical protein